MLEDYSNIEMKELASLKRISSQLLYIKLKTYKASGEYINSREEFEKYMNAGKMSTKDVKRNLIERPVEELGSSLKGKNIFKNLSYEYIKDPNDSRRWLAIRFTFNKQLKLAETIDAPEQLELDN